jgi:hypothetical protein
MDSSPLFDETIDSQVGAKKRPVSSIRPENRRKESRTAYLLSFSASLVGSGGSVAPLVVSNRVPPKAAHLNAGNLAISGTETPDE